MTPEIEIDQKVRAYLAKKGASCIVVDLAECKTCGGAVAEAYARAAKPAEVERLKRQPCRMYEADGIEVLIVNRFLHAGAHVSFTLRTFFGVKDIVVDGIS